MAGPIRISVVADAAQAGSSVRQLADGIDSDMSRVRQSMDDSTDRVRRAGRDFNDSMDSAREGFDTADERAMGFRDTITGLQDTGAGFSQLMKGDMAGGLLTLGMGVGDLASGFSNFLIPAFSKGVTWIKQLTVVQWAMNSAFLANPITWVIIAIVALVAILVLAYKKSETFRNIVNAVWATIKSAWGAIPGFVKGVVDKAWNWIKGLPDKIKAKFNAAKDILKSVGRAIVDGFKNGISEKWNAFMDWVGRQVAKIPGPVKKVLGIASPSKVFRRLGQDTGEGYRLGLADQLSQAGKDVSKLTGGLGGNVDTGALGFTSSTSSNAPKVISLQSTGDPLLDVVWEDIKHRVRSRYGGSVQIALGA